MVSVDLEVIAGTERRAQRLLALRAVCLSRRGELRHYHGRGVLGLETVAESDDTAAQDTLAPGPATLTAERLSVQARAHHDGGAPQVVAGLPFVAGDGRLRPTYRQRRAAWTQSKWAFPRPSWSQRP